MFLFQNSARSAMKYKNSKYNILFSRNSSNYLYNTLSTSIIYLDDKTLDNILNNNISNINDETVKLLLDNGLIADYDENETDHYRYFYDKTRYDKSTLNITFIPTYACNLSCIYCIQGNKKLTATAAKQKINLNPLIAFVHHKLDTEHIAEMNILLYGGEPLLQYETCCSFSEHIARLASDYSIPSKFLLVTNGTLINEPVIQKLIKPHDMRIQLTIDGNSIEHDQRRVFHTGAGSYDIIIRNLDLLIEKGLTDNVTIRINIDKDNVSQGFEIIDRMKRKSIKDVYFGLLTSLKTKSCTSYFSMDEYSSSYDPLLTSYLLSKGYVTGNKMGKTAPCSMNSENCFLIDFNLDVYKCDLFIGNKKLRVGYIDELGSLILLPNYYKQMNRSPFYLKKCKECILLPACAGGCAAMAYYEKKTINAPYCEVSKNLILNGIKTYLETHEQDRKLNSSILRNVSPQGQVGLGERQTSRKMEGSIA
jgi:uncharacterized protein